MWGWWSRPDCIRLLQSAVTDWGDETRDEKLRVAACVESRDLWALENEGESLPADCGGGASDWDEMSQRSNEDYELGGNQHKSQLYLCFCCFLMEEGVKARMKEHEDGDHLAYNWKNELTVRCGSGSFTRYTTEQSKIMREMPRRRCRSWKKYCRGNGSVQVLIIVIFPSS